MSEEKAEIAYRDSAGVRFFSKKSILQSEKAEKAFRIADKTVKELNKQRNKEDHE